MISILHNSTASHSMHLLISVLFITISQLSFANENSSLKPNYDNNKPKIQIAILLDTSNSMDGLINQTRNQLWQVVNEFSTTTRNGEKPSLEVALFEYGNDNNSKHTGFIRKLSGFTTELDQISEALFSLKTNGGSEYCGFAINTATANLRWSNDDRDLKAIFIAGNETFTQGPIHFQNALRLAKNKGIIVNTIFAGNYNNGIKNSWQQGALASGGDYMSIDANREIVHIVAPQDKAIAELNAALNQTYLPYGKQGKIKVKRQHEQDIANSDISSGLLAKRARTKSSSFYKNDNWDLVDAINNGKISEAELNDIVETELPEALRGLTNNERVEYVQNKKSERAEIKKKILSLSEQRDNYVDNKKREHINASPSMSDALIRSIKQQATQKEFVFK